MILNDIGLSDGTSIIISLGIRCIYSKKKTNLKNENKKKQHFL